MEGWGNEKRGHIECVCSARLASTVVKGGRNHMSQQDARSRQK